MFSESLIFFVILTDVGLSLIFENFCCLSTSVSLLATGSSHCQVFAVIDGGLLLFCGVFHNLYWQFLHPYDVI